MKITLLIALVVVITAETSAQQNCTALAEAGDCSFYDCLSDKFQCRSNDYPVAYGKKYCLRFEQRRNCFTANGQTWISNVRVCLMRAIVNSNIYSSNSTTCNDIERVAFQSHPSCYVDNGFCTDILLSSTNLICLSNDVFIFKDFFNKQAFSQVYNTAILCAQGTISQFLQIVDNFISSARDFLTTLKDLLGSCSSSGLDLIFVLDASGSIGANNFITMKAFVTDILTNFDIGSDSTRVGVIRYESSASIVIPLGSINNYDQLNASINNIVYTSGGTNTHSALNLLISAFANARVNEGIPRIGIVFTDGQSNDAAATVQAAQAVQAAGITTYSFGIGSGVNTNELNAIAANNTNNVFLINNFSPSSFATKLQPLRTTACTTPAIVNFGNQLQGIIEMGQTRLLQYQFPDEGMTLAVKVDEGDLLVRGSFTVRNPTALTQDFSVQSTGSSDINYFISPDLYESSTNPSSNNNTSRRKRQTESSDRNVYLSIVGLMSNNSFSLNTTFGNTAPFVPFSSSPVVNELTSTEVLSSSVEMVTTSSSVLGTMTSSIQTTSSSVLGTMTSSSIQTRPIPSSTQRPVSSALKVAGMPLLIITLLLAVLTWFI